MGLFFWNRRKVGGLIAYHNLQDWWFDTLTKEERALILSVDDVTQGNITFSSASRLAFLSGLLSWFKKKEYYTLANKIILECEKSIDSRTSSIDKHYFFLAAINIYYPRRDDYDNALALAIDYCKRQIAISAYVKNALLKEYPSSSLPRHPGYQQLAIIYEKQQKYEDAIKILNKALREGWNEDDCRSRIEKLEKKLSKIK